MPSTRRWSVPQQRIIIIVGLTIVGIFLICGAVGMGTWAVAATGIALIVVGGVILVVSALNSRMTSEVAGWARVMTATAPPVRVDRGRCRMSLVVHAPGIESVGVKIRDPAVPVAKWPHVGAALPVMVSIDNPQRTRVLWSEVPLAGDFVVASTGRGPDGRRRSPGVEEYAVVDADFDIVAGEPYASPRRPRSGYDVDEADVVGAPVEARAASGPGIDDPVEVYETDERYEPVDVRDPIDADLIPEPIDADLMAEPIDDDAEPIDVAEPIDADLMAESMDADLIADPFEDDDAEPPVVVGSGPRTIEMDLTNLAGLRRSSGSPPASESVADESTTSNDRLPDVDPVPPTTRPPTTRPPGTRPSPYRRRHRGEARTPPEAGAVGGPAVDATPAAVDDEEPLDAAGDIVIDTVMDVGTDTPPEPVIAADVAPSPAGDAPSSEPTSAGSADAGPDPASADHSAHADDRPLTARPTSPAPFEWPLRSVAATQAPHWWDSDTDSDGVSDSESDGDPRSSAGEPVADGRRVPRNRTASPDEVFDQEELDDADDGPEYSAGPDYAPDTRYDEGIGYNPGAGYAGPS
jgi:hypothetical protein